MSFGLIIKNFGDSVGPIFSSVWKQNWVIYHVFLFSLAARKLRAQSVAHP